MDENKQEEPDMKTPQTKIVGALGTPDIPETPEVILKTPTVRIVGKVIVTPPKSEKKES